MEKLLQSLGANQRNYAEIQITIEPEFSVIAQLKVTTMIIKIIIVTMMWSEHDEGVNINLDCSNSIFDLWTSINACFSKTVLCSISTEKLLFDQAVSSNMYKITDWMSEEEEEEDEDWLF